MAGDWIKMRIDLQSHPKVVRILSALSADKFRVIGGLHAVWSVFDTHSSDGKLSGYTPPALDHVIGWPGFAEQLIEVDWLFYDGGETLEMPEFFEHNGKSAKRRAEDQKRKKHARSCPQFVRSDEDKSPRESGLEKRREEYKKNKQKPLAGFADFWLAYPRKVNKGKAEKAWQKVPPEALPAILSDLASRTWPTDTTFVPHPATYLSARGWEDEDAKPDLRHWSTEGLVL